MRHTNNSINQEVRNMRKKIPMKLQLFAEGGSGEGENNQQNNNSNNSNTQSNNQNFQFDYEKLANIVNGKQSLTEEKVLGGYFKSQGLSGDEMQQAINAYKEQKAKNTPDVTSMKSELDTANKALTESLINNQAIMEAVALGLDVKAVPYVLKMADFSTCLGQDGKVNAEEVKKALNKVLEDVPALKGNASASDSNKEQQQGFQIGASGNNNQQNDQDDMLRSIFGIKKS